MQNKGSFLRRAEAAFSRVNIEIGGPGGGSRLRTESGQHRLRRGPFKERKKEPLFCKDRYRTFHKPRLPRNLYPILPTSDLKTVALTSLLHLSSAGRAPEDGSRQAGGITSGARPGPGPRPGPWPRPTDAWPRPGPRSGRTSAWAWASAWASVLDCSHGSLGNN